MKLTPLFFAVIVFLLIRLANDIPMGTYYFAHTWQFITIELSGIVIGSYLFYYLAKKWIKYCVSHHIGRSLEYCAVMLLPILVAFLIMAVSHEQSLVSEIPALIIPVVITALVSMWLYLTHKSQYLNRLYSESQLRAQEAITAGKVAELRLLRAQFHPHFLFNMLNTIYFTIDESNEQARDTVEHLSNLLRYQLYENDAPVPIERELSALESYIEMNRVRFSDFIHITTAIDKPENSFYIYPFLLLPLVENAFKHVGGMNQTIDISLQLNSSGLRNSTTLKLTVINSIASTEDMSNKEEVVGKQDKDTGIGLQNLQRRLELLYPERHILKTSKTNRNFIAYLSLDLS